MATTSKSKADHYWRWHDALGISRPGAPSKVAAPILVAPTWVKRGAPRDKDRLPGMPVVVPRTTPLPTSMRPVYRQAGELPSHVPPTSYLKLRALKRALRACDDILKAQFLGFADSARKTVYVPETLRHWRKLNVAIAKLEFVQMPIEASGEPVPSNLRRPRDHYSGGSLLEYAQGGP